MAATKEQERKALEKIKKIVTDLGEDSYISMAFEGCFEIAEGNIENDFGCSMKQRAESSAAEAAKYKEMYESAVKDYEAEKRTVEELEQNEFDGEPDCFMAAHIKVEYLPEEGGEQDG